MTTIRQLQDEICDLYGIDRAALLGERQDPPTVRPRQLAMYLARVITGSSFSRIGREFKRDRTTIRHACRAIEGRLPVPVKHPSVG